MTLRALKWFPCYSPFVRGIHQWLVDSSHTGTPMWALMFSLCTVCAPFFIWMSIMNHLGAISLTSIPEIVSVSSADFHISYSNVMCKISSWLEQSFGTFIDDNLSKNITLQWRHNELDGISNYQHLNSLLNRLFRRRSQKTSKLHVTGPLWGEINGDRWIPCTNCQLRRKCFHLMMSSLMKQAPGMAVILCNRHYVFCKDRMYHVSMLYNDMKYQKSAYLIWSKTFSL